MPVRDIDVCTSITWKHLGPVMLDKNMRLAFPPVEKNPAIYMLIVAAAERPHAYIGETKNLRKRFGNYRLPPNGAATSNRINGLLRERLQSGTSIACWRIDRFSSELDNAVAKIDLNSKHDRLLLESAALFAVRSRGIAVLNLQS